ncbi:MAG: hypothetical protein C5B47_08090 [Verrucomicrobia bacterium]|nr:MAG: hypothetical protein C5B47_08090 [Verrucomicrobiota bacterium]
MHWTDQADDFIRENCNTLSHKDMAEILGCSERAITHRRNRLNIPSYRQQPVNEGEVFGKLTVVRKLQSWERTDKRGSTFFECICECGNWKRSYE